LCGVRPASSERSDPETLPPLARTMQASGNIPLPPMPLKKTGESIIRAALIGGVIERQPRPIH
jgi:hypothetical protein